MAFAIGALAMFGAYSAVSRVKCCFSDKISCLMSKMKIKKNEPCECPSESSACDNWWSVQSFEELDIEWRFRPCERVIAYCKHLLAFCCLSLRSERETLTKDVFLRRFIQGKTVKDIQQELYKCERTVRYNLRKIKAKFKNFAPFCTWIAPCAYAKMIPSESIRRCRCVYLGIAFAIDIKRRGIV